MVPPVFGRWKEVVSHSDLLAWRVVKGVLIDSISHLFIWWRKCMGKKVGQKWMDNEFKMAMVDGWKMKVWMVAKAKKWETIVHYCANDFIVHKCINWLWAIVNGFSIYYSVAHWSRSFKLDSRSQVPLNVLHTSVDNISNMLRFKTLPPLSPKELVRFKH